MLRVAAAALSGIGVTTASTFAGSLGLSLTQQRIGFVIGVVLIMIAGGLLLLHLRRAKRAQRRPMPGEWASVPPLRQGDGRAMAARIERDREERKAKDP